MRRSGNARRSRRRTPAVPRRPPVRKWTPRGRSHFPEERGADGGRRCPDAGRRRGWDSEDAVAGSLRRPETGYPAEERPSAPLSMNVGMAEPRNVNSPGRTGVLSGARGNGEASRVFGRGTAGARAPRARSPCAATPRRGSGRRSAPSGARGGSRRRRMRNAPLSRRLLPR